MYTEEFSSGEFSKGETYMGTYGRIPEYMGVYVKMYTEKFSLGEFSEGYVSALEFDKEEFFSGSSPRENCSGIVI